MVANKIECIADYGKFSFQINMLIALDSKTQKNENIFNNNIGINASNVTFCTVRCISFMVQ